MMNPAFAALLFSTVVHSALVLAQNSTDWSQPPVGCVEEIVPYPPEKACLDLSQVQHPQRDWPSQLQEEEREYWKGRHRALQYCRGSEVLRREGQNPGGFPGATVEVAWMQVRGVERHQVKVDAIYAASLAHKMPAQLFAGALYQESMFAEMGIAADGGNYSCGVGQVNITEWCRWANQQSAPLKRQMGWPEQAMSCALLPSGLIKPFYDIALTRLGQTPEYKLNKSHFEKIPMEQVLAGFPEGSPAEQTLRYQAALSFINNCEKSEMGIPAKANEIAHLYKNFVPSGLKSIERYPQGSGYRRKCQKPSFNEQYPMHSGWLMAIGSYNAGPKAVDALAFYQRWSRADLQDAGKLSSVNPKLLVESLYWSGAYNPKDDKIHFKLLNGNSSTWLWFKLCVLQRHIARVVTHALIPGSVLPVDSLEGNHRCARSSFDPSTGELIKSGVPTHRQVSPGQRPAERAVRPF